jgi:dTDP-4-amino-4,6-dideoxygalactose transaminase
MKTEIRSKTDRQEWNSLVDSSEEGWLFHRYEWIEQTASIHSLTNFFFLIRLKNELAAALPIQKNADDIIYSIQLGYAGPLCSNKYRELKNELFNKLFQLLKVWIEENNIARTYITLPPLSQSCFNNLHGINPLINYYFDDVSTHTNIINLRKPENELWSDLSESARTKIRKAIKQEYSIKEVFWKDYLHEYYTLHEETYKRTGADPRQIIYFKLINKLNRTQNSILYAAFDKNNSIVAFHNAAIYKNTGFYWTGCSKSEEMHSGVNYLLMWESIKNAKKIHCEYFDVGELFPNSGDKKLSGLSNFKSKFGGTIYRFYKGAYIPEQTPSNSLSSKNRAENKSGKSTILSRLIKRIKRKLILIFNYAIFKMFRETISFLEPTWSEIKAKNNLIKNIKISDTKLDDKLRIEFGIGNEYDLLLMNNRLSALTLILKVIKEKNPDKNEIIMSAYNHASILKPTLDNDLLPIFVDINERLITHEEEYIKRITEKTLACLISHNHGLEVDYNKLYEKSLKLNFQIIEDNSFAVGKYYYPMKKGYSDIAFFDFNIGASLFGGGCLLIINKLNDYFKKAIKNLNVEDDIMTLSNLRSIQNKDIPGQFIDELSLNNYTVPYLISNLSKTILFNQLPNLKVNILKIFNQAKSILKSIEKLQQIQTPLPKDNCMYSELVLVLNKKNQKRFVSHMAERGIITRIPSRPLHITEDGFDFYREQLENSENFYKKLVYLPLRPNLNKLQVYRIKKAICAFR